MEKKKKTLILKLIWHTFLFHKSDHDKKKSKQFGDMKAVREVVPSAHSTCTLLIVIVK